MDICSYHPLMPPALVRVERDDDYIVLLSRYVGEFLDELDTQYERLVEKVGGPVLSVVTVRKASQQDMLLVLPPNSLQVEDAG